MELPFLVLEKKKKLEIKASKKDKRTLNCLKFTNTTTTQAKIYACFKADPSC